MHKKALYFSIIIFQNRPWNLKKPKTWAHPKTPWSTEEDDKCKPTSFVSVIKVLNRSSLFCDPWFSSSGTADAEIKVLSERNPERSKGSLFKISSRSECSLACFDYRQKVCLSVFRLSGSFSFIFCARVSVS